MLATVRRVAAAVPDAAMAAFFLHVWRDPLGFGPTVVGDLLVVMLIEFLLVHSGGFIGSLLLSETLPRWRKTLGVLGFGAFYLLFVFGFALGMNRWWAVPAFLWLIASRVALVWFAPVPRDEEARRQAAIWGGSVAIYILGVFVTVILPIPEWGLTRDVASQLGIAQTGRGIWQQHPQVVLAFGALYFTAMACLRWSLAVPQTKTPASPLVPESKWPWKPKAPGSD